MPHTNLRVTCKGLPLFTGIIMFHQQLDCINTPMCRFFASSHLLYRVAPEDECYS